MSGPRVLLTTLSVRTSAKGNTYLSGWLGKASVVAFQGEPDKYGNETWDLFLCEPEPRDRPAASTPPPRGTSAPQESAAASGRAMAPPSPTARPGGSHRPFHRESAAARQDRVAGEIVREHGADVLDDAIPF
jgi:hypothetical protein